MRICSQDRQTSAGGDGFRLHVHGTCGVRIRLRGLYPKLPERAKESFGDALGIGFLNGLKGILLTHGG